MTRLLCDGDNSTAAGGSAEPPRGSRRVLPCGARQLREGRGLWLRRLRLPRGVAQVRMRRSPRSGSAASSHNHTPNFYSENSNSSHSATSGDSNGRRSAGPELGEPEGRRARGSSCGEPALSPGMPGGDTWAGSSRPKLAPRSHNGQTACGAATVRGGASGAGGVEPGGERAGRARGRGPARTWVQKPRPGSRGDVLDTCPSGASSVPWPVPGGGGGNPVPGHG